MGTLSLSASRTGRLPVVGKEVAFRGRDKGVGAGARRGPRWVVPGGPGGGQWGGGISRQKSQEEGRGDPNNSLKKKLQNYCYYYLHYPIMLCVLLVLYHLYANDFYLC